MEPMWMLLGLVLGAAAAAAIARDRVRGLTEELVNARTERDARAQRCGEVTEEKLTEVGALSAQLAGVQAELQGALVQVKTLTEARSDLLAQVGEKAAEVFAGSGKALVDLAKSEMKTVTAEALAEFDKRGKEVTTSSRPSARS
jgi:hypothetical protein